VNVLMPEPYKSEHDSYLENFHKTGIPKIIGIGRDVILRTKTGQIIPIHLSVTEQGEGDSQMFTGILTPSHDGKPNTKGLVEQQREVLEMLLIPAIVIDQIGSVQIMNKAATELLGWTEEEIMGKNVRKLVPSPDKEKHDRYIKRYIKTGKSRVLGTGRDVVAEHKDGTNVPVHLSVTEKLDMDGKRFFIGVMQRI